MTPHEFNDALQEIGWKPAQLTSMLGCSHTLPYAWRKGVTPIPDSVARWLTRLARAHNSLPAPDDWRVRE